MTNFWSENRRRLMSQYKFKINTDLNHENLCCSLCSNLMIDAYQSHCGCNYCHACIVKFLADGEKYCQGGNEECKEECLMLEKNVSRSSILDKKVSKVRVHCPNDLCESIAELKEIEEHLKICKQRHVECPYTVIGCGIEGASTDKIMVHLDDDKLTHSQLLIGLFNDLKDEFTSLREIQRNEKIEGANLKRRMTTEIKHLKDELKRVKTIMTTVRPNVTSFTVDTFSVRKMSKEKVISPYFYSHTNGYKLRLCIFPGGLDGLGTDMSVYLQIRMGKYDDILPWPCKSSFTLSITDQRDGSAYGSKTFTYETAPDWYKDEYNKPMVEVNRGIGRFYVSHAELESVVGIVDNSVIIQCVVSDSL